MGDDLFPIFITGATGLLGRCILRYLVPLADGRPIYVGGRSREKFLSQSGGSAIFVEVDLGRDGFTLPSDSRTIINVAGEKCDISSMFEVNVGGTARLLKAASVLRLNRFLHISTVGVYGAGGWSGDVGENFPQSPQNWYELSKAKAERLVSHHLDGANWCDRVITLRPSTVLDLCGNMQTPLLGFIRAVYRGRLVLPSDRDGCFNYISVENVAATVAYALLSSEMRGAYNVSTPCNVSDVVARVRDELSVRRPVRRVPRYLLSAAGVFGDALELAGVRSPVNSAKVLELSGDTRFSPEKLLGVGGFRFPFDIRDEIAAAAHRYLRRGLL